MTAPDFFADLETDQSTTPDFFGDLQQSNETPKVMQPQQSQPDFFAEIEEQRPYATPYDVPFKSREELSKMSYQEKLEYARDLKTERRYRQSKGIIKGVASGATFGLSEKIPGLKPEEGDFLVGFGEFLGSGVPISNLYNFLGKPLVTLASKSPKYAKGLQSLARMTGFGLTGATYEGVKETVKTGEAPSPQELMKYGLQWAAFDGALQVVGKAASTFLPKLKGVAQENAIPEKQVLNTVMDRLAERNINIQKDPQKAVQVAQEILDNYPKTESITQIERPISEKPITSKKTPPIPIIEKTGEGAFERIEQPKTSFDKIVDSTNNFIQAAKTPGESLKRLGEATNESIFNSLAPLERIETEIPVHEKASTRIKMAQSAASEINSVLENGIFSNVTGNFEHGGLKEAYGDLTWKRLSKGLKESEYSIEDLDAYRTSKAALKRQGEGKKTGVDTQKAIADINRLQKKYEPIDNRIRDFQKATISHYGKDLLGNDLIDLWNKDYYSPLFRVMDSGSDSVLKTGSLTPKQPFKKMKGSERKIMPPSESDPYNASMLISNAKKNDAVLQYRQLVLEGKLPGKIRDAKNKLIPDLVQKDLELNPEMHKVAENLYNQTRTNAYTPEKNTIRGWKDGKSFDIEVPEDIFNVFSTLAPQDRGSIAKVFSFFNRMFSKGISFAPRKFASIVSRDALSSLIYSKTGSNPISIAEALGDIYGGKDVYKEFLSIGGDVYASRLAERIDRTKRIEDLITPGKEGILVPFEKMGDYLRKYEKQLGNISMAVPLAEYKRALEVYGNTPEGRIAAAMSARQVVYDPTVKGSSKIVRELGNFVPFWNVSLQDLAMLGRNLNTPEAWMKGFYGITIPTMILKTLNEGNPDYQDLTPVDKAAFWHVYFGDKHLRIPIPWLLGTAFKVGAETFYDNLHQLTMKKDKRAIDAWKGLYHNFTENLSGKLPPLLQSYIELSTGKSAPSPLGLILGTESRAPEVIPRRLQDLPPELQYNPKTSPIVKKFADLWGISPIKLERTVSNFGGLIAKDALALMDEMAYATGMPDDNRPEQKEANYLLLGNFLSNSPSRTKYAEEFYNYLREATQNKNAEKLIRQKGLQDKEVEKLSYKDVPIFRRNKQVSDLFKKIRTIEDDKSISPREKKDLIDQQQRKINSIYKDTVEDIRSSHYRRKSNDT